MSLGTDTKQASLDRITVYPRRVLVEDAHCHSVERPGVPASQNPQLRGGSSVVERRFEEPSVGGSTPFRHIFDNLRRLCYRRKACTKGKSISQ